MPDDDHDVGPPTFGELWRRYHDHINDDADWKRDHEDGHRWLYRTIGSLLIAAAIAILVAVASTGTGG